MGTERKRTREGRDGDPIADISRRVEEITRENQALFVRLLDGERRFRRLAKAVWMVQEDERRRLARELHDGIGQTLAALKNQLGRLHQRAGEDPIAVSLADSVELVSTALNDTRELSRLLRPPVLDDLGLEAALNWLGRTLHQRTGLRVVLDCDIGERRLGAETETLVFRIIQESLTNVMKHAGVAEARVSVTVVGNGLRAHIEDDGVGFDPVSASEPGAHPLSSGLRGMRDRVELFGGRLKIDSGEGSGTVVELLVPLAGENEND